MPAASADWDSGDTREALEIDSLEATRTRPMVTATSRQARAQQMRRLHLVRQLTPRPRVAWQTRALQAGIWAVAVVVAALVMVIVALAGYFLFVLLNHFAGETGW